MRQRPPAPLLLVTAGLLILAGLAVWSAGHRPGILVGFAALYLEETGIPMPIPGDTIVAYVGTRLPHHPHSIPFVVAWLGLTLCVVFGASNLYLLSWHLGPRLLEGKVGQRLHVDSRRLAQVEQWFGRNGFLTVMVGRHIPGFRIPLTVVAGLLGYPYPKFAAAVAISAAFWTGLYLYLGMIYGHQVLHAIEAHWPWAIVGSAVMVAIWLGIRHLRQRSKVIAAPEHER